MNSPVSDASIPLLTEIIPAEADNAPSGPAASLEKNVPPPTARAEAILSLSEDQWTRLERDIRDRIADQLRARVDTLIEQRIRESVGDMLQVVMKVMVQEVRVSLHQALDDTVSEAVAAQLASLRK